MTNFLRYSARASVIAVALGVAALAQQPTTTQPPTGNTLGTDQFVPFDQFIANTSGAAFNSAATATAKVASDAAFTEMRQHIMNLYRGVHVTHSFVQGAQTYDCIPEEQQPSVRMLGLKGIAAPPAAPSDLQSAPPPADGATVLPQSGEAIVSSLLPTTAVDRFGNATACEAHTVPIQRTTVEQMIRFPTLRAFLSKTPNATGVTPAPPKPGAALNSVPASLDFSNHKQNNMVQNVYNLGGNSNINIWNPNVLFFSGEVFSLSQVWYMGSAANGLTQTVEAGWQVFPQRLGDFIDHRAHLFIYYTADGYGNTGCYDHSCAGFVQYSGRVFPGVALPPSMALGNQTEINTLWQWSGGNWWLSVNGEWIGYYPASLFGNGEMATHASKIQYGGEIVGGTSYPPMGSGEYAASWFSLAAYQRHIWYVDALGRAQSPSLGAVNECISNTRILGPYDGGSSWGTYFFFGGPRGTCSFF